MIDFHPMVRRDVTAAMRHYEAAQPHLADDFWARFEAICADVEAILGTFILMPVDGAGPIFGDFPITFSFRKSWKAFGSWFCATNAGILPSG